MVMGGCFAGIRGRHVFFGIRRVGNHMGKRAIFYFFGFVADVAIDVMQETVKAVCFGTFIGKLCQFGLDFKSGNLWLNAIKAGGQT